MCERYRDNGGRGVMLNDVGADYIVEEAGNMAASGMNVLIVCCVEGEC